MTSPPLHRCRLAVFADYFQFYVWDPVISLRQAPVEWTERDGADRAKIAEGVFVCCPVRNMTVPVEIGIWKEAPEIDYDAWQHVVEAPLVTQGTIEVEECTGYASLAAFTVEPGAYTIRALYRGLDTLSNDGLDGGDFYEVQIWKGPCAGLKVIRRWEA